MPNLRRLHLLPRQSPLSTYLPKPASPELRLLPQLLRSLPPVRLSGLPSPIWRQKLPEVPEQPQLLQCCGTKLHLGDNALPPALARIQHNMFFNLRLPAGSSILIASGLLYPRWVLQSQYFREGKGCLDSRGRSFYRASLATGFVHSAGMWAADAE